jgi:hypothetical protein
LVDRNARVVSVLAAEQFAEGRVGFNASHAGIGEDLQEGIDSETVVCPYIQNRYRGPLIKSECSTA